MRLKNHVLHPFLEKFIMVYFDDILVYSKNLDKHVEHLRAVLEMLRKERLYVNLKKWYFCTNQLVFFTFVVNSQGIHVDEGKVKTIQDWPTPKTVSEVRIFYCLTNFYWWFVKDFSTIIAPSTIVIKTIEKFLWGETQEKGFCLRKHRLTHVSLLSLPDFNQNSKIKCDILGISFGDVLIQGGNLGAYFSEKPSGQFWNTQHTTRNCLL